MKTNPKICKKKNEVWSPTSLGYYSISRSLWHGRVTLSNMTLQLCLIFILKSLNWHFVSHVHQKFGSTKEQEKEIIQL